MSVHMFLALDKHLCWKVAGKKKERREKMILVALVVVRVMFLEFNFKNYTADPGHPLSPYT